MLLRVAYRMLGSIADAEDVVQDAWLRWAGTDREEVLVPEAYLRRVDEAECEAQPAIRSTAVRRGYRDMRKLARGERDG